MREAWKIVDSEMKSFKRFIIIIDYPLYDCMEKRIRGRRDWKHVDKQKDLVVQKRQWKHKVGHLGLEMKRWKRCENTEGTELKLVDCVFGNQEIESKKTISSGSWVAGDAFYWDKRYMNNSGGKDKFIFNMLSMRYCEVSG